MANSADKAPIPPPQPYSPGAALLSYLVPGLGQIVQGRVGKGLLFMICVYALFFYGLLLGQGTVSIARGAEPNSPIDTYSVSSNVYLPTAEDRGQPVNAQTNPLNLPLVILDLYHRPQFLGQFWMGVVVWPAIWQYSAYNKEDKEHPVLRQFMRTPGNEALNAVHTSGSKLLELGWVYTVIAGVLNIMIIYDALAGPAYPPQPNKEPTPNKETPNKAAP